jgi:hypothetical protein
MRVKIFYLSWNVDLNRLENEINAFLATLSEQCRETPTVCRVIHANRRH